MEFRATDEVAMISFRKSTLNVFTLLISGLVSACAGIQGHVRGPQTAVLPPERGLVVFMAKTVGETPKRRVQYADELQRVDYALYEGQGAHAEFAYMETPYNSSTAFEFPYTIRDKVEAWNFNKNHAIAWDGAVYVRTALGGVHYRPYQLTDVDRSCFGVSGEWDPAVDDRQLRKTRILIGYYCAPPGNQLSSDGIESLVKNIGLKGLTVPHNNYADRTRNFYGDIDTSFGGRQQNAQAIELAKGRAIDGSAGIDEFPFDYAIYYSPNSDPSP